MAVERLYGIEFKDIPNGNKYLGGGVFRKKGSGYESYLNLQGTKVRFPVEIHPNGVMFEATYPDGSKGYVDYRVFSVFDFDEDSNVW